MVYPDVGTGSDKADVFLRRFPAGGVDWSPAVRVNDDATTTDQWQPAIAAKPDGSKLFIAWYDRREDPENNSLIRTYGRIGTMQADGTIQFAPSFPISSTAFEPVFTGRTMTSLGQFDPAYPPVARTDGVSCPTFYGAYAPHMGDYDTAAGTDGYIYYTWADHRDIASGTHLPRYEANIRMVKKAW